jgi:hypothetical protein
MYLKKQLLLIIKVWGSIRYQLINSELFQLCEIYLSIKHKMVVPTSFLLRSHFHYKSIFPSYNQRTLAHTNGAILSPSLSLFLSVSLLSSLVFSLSDSNSNLFKLSQITNSLLHNSDLIHVHFNHLRSVIFNVKNFHNT